MPLLKRKRLPEINVPSLESGEKGLKNKQVWYLPMSNEIFLDYDVYLHRLMLYRQPIWQCETTGRSNLTYAQALESERKEKERVGDRFPEQLKAGVLKRLQFRTDRLEAVVEDIYSHFLDQYLPGEVIHCKWDDGIMYNARILDVVQGHHGTTIGTNADTNVQKASSTNGTGEHKQYKVQLIDQDLEGIDDCIRLVTSDDLKRDRLAYSKNMLKKVIRECAVKDSYIGAPWIVKPAIADRYDIDSTLPAHLQEGKDKALLKSRKRKPQSSAEKEEEARNKAKNKEEEQEARKRLMSLKYPIEDLDLPVYRRPNLEKKDVPLQAKAESKITDPLGNHGQRPLPSAELGVPEKQFNSFLLIWNFLNTFSKPLHLSPFSIDDFEQALHYTSSSPVSQLIVEANVALINTIIRERRKKNTAAASMVTGNLMVPNVGYSSRSASPAVDLSAITTRTNTPDLEANGDVMMKDELREDVSFSSDGEVVMQLERTTISEKGWGSNEAFNVGKGWSLRSISLANGREGWEQALIGCLNELANPGLVPDLDSIIRHLLPSGGDEDDDGWKSYATLSVVHKIQIFNFLVHVVNECAVIKEYMEDCQEHMTELRKEKIEVNRELKRIMAERLELERNENAEAEVEDTNDLMQSESEALSDEEDEEDEEEEDIRKVQRRAEHESRHKSRQAKLKQRQLEREALENRRLKMYQQQRAEARAKSQEMKLKAEQRRKLDENERHLHKKGEQIERDMRRYATLRVRSLGRDRFYNKYYYFDNIGGSCIHGTGRLYIQSPSDADILVLTSRDDPDPIDAEELPCGRGGGINFVTQLMRAQGLAKEAEWLLNRVASLRADFESRPEDASDKWSCYTEPEEVDALLEWFNPQGVREYRLKNEIQKQYHSLVTGMKKRIHDQQASNIKAAEVPRRSTRTKTVVQVPLGSWLAYANKSAI